MKYICNHAEVCNSRECAHKEPHPMIKIIVADDHFIDCVVESECPMVEKDVKCCEVKE